MLALNSLNGAALARIRDQLGGDLAAHIHLSQTCRKTRRLYEDDAVWQAACFRAGFGRPRQRTITRQSLRQLTWRALAYMLVKHASRCEIRSCKDANACFAKQYRRMSRTSIRAPPPPSRGIAMHPLYYYLHFAESPAGSPHMPSPDTLAILLTHLPTFPESKSLQYGPLCVHPNASCAFATFPPMQSISFEDANGDPFLTVRNPDGCTILDVNRALGDLVPQGIEQLDLALAHYRELLFTSGLSSAQFAEHISRDRGFLDDHEYPFLQELVAQA